MKKKIELGNSIKLISNKSIVTAGGTHLFLKGTIGLVCDVDNPNCPLVEIKDSNGFEMVVSFELDDFDIID